MEEEIIKVRSFEECEPEITRIIRRKKNDWTFKASVMMDFEDFYIETLDHIWKKWHLYDQRRELGAWVATTVNNQWINALRDLYTSTSSPCLRCSLNLGGDRCKLFEKTESLECNLFKKWYHNKRHNHNARLPVSIDDKMNEIPDHPDTIIDLEGAANNLHKRIKEKLTASEWDIYDRLYIKCLSDEETASQLGFKTTEHGRKMGNKRIRDVKRIIIAKAKEAINEHGIETIV